MNLIPAYWDNMKNAQLLDEVITVKNFDIVGGLFNKAQTFYFKKYEHPLVYVYMDHTQEREIQLSPKSIQTIIRPSTREVIYEKDFRTHILGSDLNGGG